MTWLGEHVMETVSGRGVDLASPAPASIDLGDVAHGLAHTCRFGGQCSRFYSVAEHAVLVHDLVHTAGADPTTLTAALHHDDHEAYVGDVPSPLKPLLGAAWMELVARVDAAVAAWLGIELALFDAPAIKEADRTALMLEARALMASAGAGWARDRDVWLPGGVEWFGGLTPPAARDLFISRAAGAGVGAVA